MGRQDGLEGFGMVFHILAVPQLEAAGLSRGLLLVSQGEKGSAFASKTHVSRHRVSGPLSDLSQ